MPEICFYEPWTYQLSLPEKIEAYLKFAKKKRISYEAEDCSRYNTRTNGKSAKLHPPTLAAIFKLFGMKEKKKVLPEFSWQKSLFVIFAWNTRWSRNFVS